MITQIKFSMIKRIAKILLQHISSISLIVLQTCTLFVVYITRQKIRLQASSRLSPGATDPRLCGTGLKKKKRNDIERIEIKSVPMVLEKLLTYFMYSSGVLRHIGDIKKPSCFFQR